MAAKKEEKARSQDFNVDEALERLEEINGLLAGGDLPLQEAIGLYKEGVLLATEAKAHLEGVEQELQIVNSEE